MQYFKGSIVLALSAQLFMLLGSSSIVIVQIDLGSLILHHTNSAYVKPFVQEHLAYYMDM